MKKTDWATIKQWYVQGEQGPEGLRYATLEELAKRAHRNDSSVRHKASIEKWAEQRKQFTAKVENLTAERKSTVMAGESVEFDSEVLKAARKGIELVNRELNFALGNEMPKDGDLKDKLHYIEACIDAIAKYGKALKDYQAAGKLAFGENPDVDKDITIKVKYDDNNSTPPQT